MTEVTSLDTYMAGFWFLVVVGFLLWSVLEK